MKLAHNSQLGNSPQKAQKTQKGFEANQRLKLFLWIFSF